MATPTRLGNQWKTKAGKAGKLMWVLLIASVALLFANLGYCILKARADFAGPTPSHGIWGILAALGLLSALLLLAFSLLIGLSGVQVCF
ncbi:hypothetical protein [Novosphingobium ginsenosidimutans]|uniref:Uncharacterized protein n=1 Tax=Novosphingobium ginsenosidimutans TaxID=1176536 RepID=A0A5B8S236_9SPHN|nr:hypothetical protein [Novosphingobium ginsenosidimutans]QEA15194.1 hypothetical protein FRF71_03025 [Novosphingobium ginsenosidimutans]